MARKHRKAKGTGTGPGTRGRHKKWKSRETRIWNRMAPRTAWLKPDE